MKQAIRVEFKPLDGFAIRAEWIRFFGGGGGDVDLDAPSVNLVSIF